MRNLVLSAAILALSGCETVDEAFSDLDLAISGGCERLSAIFDREGMMKDGGHLAIDRLGYDSSILREYRVRYCQLAAEQAAEQAAE